jgi:hypothetical protein
MMNGSNAHQGAEANIKSGWNMAAVGRRNVCEAAGKPHKINRTVDRKKSYEHAAMGVL